MQAKLCDGESNPHLLSPFDDHIKRREQPEREAMLCRVDGEREVVSQTYRQLQRGPEC
jgi:hypothetical protein